MDTTITPQIVNLTATVTRAPTPSQLQRSGALISVGGTTQAAGAMTYVGALSAAQALLSTTGNYQEVDNMATTFFAQGNAVGAYVLELGNVSGVDAQITALQTWITDNPGQLYAYLCPADWDYSKDEVGSVQITSGGSGYTSAPSVTFSAPSSGTTASGTATIQNGSVVAVTVTAPGSGYTAAPTVTFSAPASGTTASGTATLATALNILAGDYSEPTGKTYFFGTTSSGTIGNYTTNKALVMTAPAPTAPSTEFTAAMPFYQWLANQPSQATPLAPMAFRYAYGVTPWPQTGQSAAVNAILTAYGNLIYTGAEGGISTATLFKGTTMDGGQAAWWYGVDWFQIQVKQALAAAIINGSNSNPPLLYNQAGINTMQAIAQNLGNSAVKFGCALLVTVTATDFSTYTTENPNDYKAGIYNGLSATMVGPSGFLTITFTLDAVQFVQ